MAARGPGGRLGAGGRGGTGRDDPAGDVSRRTGGHSVSATSPERKVPAVSAALETTGLGKRYGSFWALRDCTLALPTGRVAALVGPNGAGKTTLLHLAVGLARPDAGLVRVLGQAPANNNALLARVGFVAQDTPLYRGYTVAEMLTLGAQLNRRFDTALARDRLGRLD